MLVQLAQLPLLLLWLLQHYLQQLDSNSMSHSRRLSSRAQHPLLASAV